jgi:hypothetical protein
MDVTETKHYRHNIVRILKIKNETAMLIDEGKLKGWLPMF